MNTTAAHGGANPISWCCSFPSFLFSQNFSNIPRSCALVKVTSMEEGAGSLGVVQQKATVQRSSSNQSGTQNHAGIKINNRTGIHALAASAAIHASAGVGIRPGTGHYIPQVPNQGSGQGDWYEVGSIRSGHYSGAGGYASSIGNPSISTRRRIMLPGPLNQPPPKSNWSKFKDAFRSFVAWVFSNVGICVLVVGYLIIGALTFQQIEGPEEVKISYRVGQYRKDIVQKLWDITDKYNVLEFEKWKSESEAVVMDFQNHVVEQTDNGYDGSDGHPNQWTFSGSLLYSITVITTIGKPFYFNEKLVTIFFNRNI